MKVQVLKADFAKILSLACRFVSNRAQLPILGNLILSAKGNCLTVMSTNLEISVVAKLGAKVTTEGELGVPARTIVDIVSNLGNGPVNLESQEEQLLITTDSFEGKVSGINTSDFPKLPQTVEKGIKILARDLALGLSKVSFSTSMDETRPILTGVLFLFNGTKLSLVASDGFRLSKFELTLKESQPEMKIVIPKSAINELIKLAGEYGQEFVVDIRQEENQVVFGIGDVVFSTRTLEGEFPNFEKIIPANSLVKVNVDKEEFSRSIKLAAVFAREASNIAKMKLLEKGVEISAESQKSGNQKTVVEAKIEGLSGDFEIIFNYRFLEEYVALVDGGVVDIGFNETNSPGVFHDLTHPNFLHLIMPVKIQG
ncbi:MAG: DNA polymerase III subunit beta [Patescibacteria group bacterium]